MDGPMRARSVRAIRIAIFIPSVAEKFVVIRDNDRSPCPLPLPSVHPSIQRADDI